MSTPGSVVVTGASTGIGEACALRLDRRGFRVFAGVRREVDGGALKQKASSRLTPILLDVTDASSIKSAAAAVVAALGEEGLSGLVNNAGIAIAGPLEFLPIDELRRQFEVNVIGQIAVTQAFLPLLRKGHGRIVNMGSIAGKSALPFTGPYCASKFALEALTDSLRNIVSNIRKTALNNDVSADVVARVVEHALTANRPRTRYLVGTAALLRVLLGILPDRTRDRLITWRLLRVSIHPGEP